MTSTTKIANRFREVILNGTWIANTNFKAQLRDLDWKTATAKYDSLNTIVALAQSMGFNVIAEGVETEEQRKFLAANGCTSYQGYLFGRPMPADDFSRRFFEVSKAPCAIVGLIAFA